MNDTIYAPATAHGKAGVAVIRVSGPHADDSAHILTGADTVPARRARLYTLKHPVSGATLDRALVIRFQAPHSYTGENVVEYHTHGGRAVVQGVLEALGTQKHHRMAQPGEFTRRAFENGKMDLTEAEAVADLINAQTQMQKAQALSQMGGALAHLYENWRDQLTRILAHIETDIEFPEEDLPGGLMPQIISGIEVVIADITAHLDDNRRGERLRGGIHVAVIGAPNAGKSSLVNALAQRDIAIVSETAGTTRDVIETHLDIAGYPVILSDTAGLRSAGDPVESEGIRRAAARARQADIRVVLYDGGAEKPDADSRALEAQDHTIVLINKADRPVKLKHPARPRAVSVLKNEGISGFLEDLTRMIVHIAGNDGDAPALTRTRHREALHDCREALERALKAPLPELAAEDVRLAVRDLGRITGKVDIEDVLDVVFRDFCIGK